MPRTPFADHAVVLTGASSGIGRHLALQLAEQGAKLVLASRGQERLGAVALACRERGAEAEAVATDVADEAACKALVERAVARFGRIDVLINNAGRTMWSLFEEMKTLDPFRRLMEINYLGSVYCTYYALPHLKRSRGRIVAVSSLTGKTGVPTRSGYAASKHAMVGFFDTLRIELLGSGISVTVACPDFVATETRARAFGADGRPIGTSPVQEGRIMSAEVCARRILRGAARRRRELVMSRRGKLGLWLKLIAPGLVDRIALAAIRRGR
ncbi:MAG: SDR family oxidoreductase [Acidobacteria bacterium]|nr:MAG: SDR family oxidoreductase [Acidobacteriota bacterium]